MFSGIVEATGKILKSEGSEGLVRIDVERPEDFSDVRTGDSISTNGVCLTIEKFDQHTMTFALAAETLSVLGISDAQKLTGQKLNLERSLRFGDRIHGHLVTGHVDSLGQLVDRKAEGESLFLSVKVQKTVLPYVWKKGSITLNGTSLTVNQLDGDIVNVCLIPETLKRTNLGEVQVGQTLTVEPDYMARAVARTIELGQPEGLQTQKAGNKL